CAHSWTRAASMTRTSWPSGYSCGGDCGSPKPGQAMKASARPSRPITSQPFDQCEAAEKLANNTSPRHQISPARPLGCPGLLSILSEFARLSTQGLPPPSEQLHAQ